MSANYAIEICGLEKIFAVGFWRKRPKTALKPLHLAVEHNEVFGFLGPNGAGKTTTLKLLMGLITQTSGTAKLLGCDWREPDVKRQIGFLPEQPYFYDYLTARELLNYYAALSEVPAKGRDQRVRALLGRVGLAQAADTQLRKFSKGMLQRVGIAQAILHDPKLVILDEPTTGLDPMGRREVRDLIQDLQDEGKTVFFSTHILSDAEALCDRVGVIHKGELKGVGIVADLVNRNAGCSQTELVWHGKGPITAVAALGGKCRVAADTVRATVPSTKLEAALDAIRQNEGRIVSVTPVRTTLEDYFLERLAERPSASAMEAVR
jgi:ABC-2 type transport system ATP-binding protein